MPSTKNRELCCCISDYLRWKVYDFSSLNPQSTDKMPINPWIVHEGNPLHVELLLWKFKRSIWSLGTIEASAISQNTLLK